MSKQIWKFKIEGFECKIQMPADAEILDAQMQNDAPVIWAAVDTEEELEERTFVLVSTGQDIDENDDLEHIATFQLAGGKLVYHLLEKQIEPVFRYSPASLLCGDDSMKYFKEEYNKWATPQLLGYVDPALETKTPVKE